jgi:hypothetical protein
MGSITVGMTYTWYDFYRDPRDLERVRAAVDQHATQPVDWQTLLAHEIEKPFGFEFFYIEHGPIFADALDRLCDTGASATKRVDFLPIEFAFKQRFIDMGGSWRLYSAKRMRDVVLMFGEDELRYPELAERYQQGDRSDEVVGGYCLDALIQIADACYFRKLPAGVTYS